jgi:hypothetical protein
MVDDHTGISIVGNPSSCERLPLKQKWLTEQFLTETEKEMS